MILTLAVLLYQKKMDFNETITYYYFQNDMTVRDYAEANNCDNIISIIDKV